MSLPFSSLDPETIRTANWKDREDKSIRQNWIEEPKCRKKGESFLFSLPPFHFCFHGRTNPRRRRRRIFFFFFRAVWIDLSRRSKKERNTDIFEGISGKQLSIQFSQKRLFSSFLSFIFSKNIKFDGWASDAHTHPVCLHPLSRKDTQNLSITSIKLF